MFGSAKQAEIVRSNQKDGYYLGYIKGALADTVQTLMGPATWIKWRKELDVVAGLGYFGLTTLAGFQTLGEEYVNIVQVDPSMRAIPSRWRRGAMIFLQISAPYVFDKLLSSLEQQLQRNRRLALRPEARLAILEAIPVLRHVITLIYRCHLAVFYMRGIFYHIAKRLTGINYILVRRQGESESRASYRVLGWLSVVQLGFLFLQQLYKFVYKHLTPLNRVKLTVTDRNSALSQPTEAEDTSGFVDPSRKCSLCLEARKQSTATPCGHMFCWTCITEWAETKTECPLCREEFAMSRLVPLQNYDPT